MYQLLNTINTPQDVRALHKKQLIQLAVELRDFIIESVSKTGGHLASNLGTVELTVALHYIFDTPKDKLVWDVGHQTYAHKILTGRRDQMGTLRKFGGIAGFPSREESEYDSFGTAHSSTSISAALGMAVSAQLRGDENRVVAIIGDGAMSAGMAFEALNNAGAMDANILVVLNDNDMSISENVGALNNYLARLLSGRFYSAAWKAGETVFKKLPPVIELARRAEEHVKGMVMPGTLFEEFGFNYIGPIDGHDLDVLCATLRNLRKLEGPQFLHVVTTKGKGYQRAEEDAILYHGVGKFDPPEGIQKKSSQNQTYTQVFGQWLCDMAAKDDRLIGITPAMREGSGLVEFSQQYPDRYFDVGIAEQHAVTFAAGLATEGFKPVLAIYSTFLQRAYDQLIHDVCIQNLDVTFALDRSGLVGADGPTHHGAFDLAYLRCVPNVVIMTPSDATQCAHMLNLAYEHPGPAVVRYPRGDALVATHDVCRTVHMGKAELIKEGNSGVAILVFGPLLKTTLFAADKLNATVVDMRFVKPLDVDMVQRIAEKHLLIVTVEDGVSMGGGGSAVGEVLEKKDLRFLRIGLPDKFVTHGDTALLLKECGLDERGIFDQINAYMG
ncbi:MAG: 1-deoxy-D-xylulose-5-phosphate synthase [Proteobacteria bacterium]|nr:1-deoxy-D-xylulose-5-phosphate synthase [Pseudomonadota bacterium]